MLPFASSKLAYGPHCLSSHLGRANKTKRVEETKSSTKRVSFGGRAFLWPSIQLPLFFPSKAQPTFQLFLQLLSQLQIIQPMFGLWLWLCPFNSIPLFFLLTTFLLLGRAKVQQRNGNGNGSGLVTLVTADLEEADLGLGGRQIANVAQPQPQPQQIKTTVEAATAATAAADRWEGQESNFPAGISLRQSPDNPPPAISSLAIHSLMTATTTTQPSIPHSRTANGVHLLLPFTFKYSNCCSPAAGLMSRCGNLGRRTGHGLSERHGWMDEWR
jgi:hypothetical protein